MCGYALGSTLSCVMTVWNIAGAGIVNFGVRVVAALRKRKSSTPMPAEGQRTRPVTRAMQARKSVPPENGTRVRSVPRVISAQAEHEVEEPVVATVVAVRDGAKAHALLHAHGRDHVIVFDTPEARCRATCPHARPRVLRTAPSAAGGCRRGRHGTAVSGEAGSASSRILTSVTVVRNNTRV